jgi:uncharacterized Fe-S cluster protein YjdI
MDIKKEYSNGELTVVWKPGLCFHAKECVKGLPDVFNPNLKPWIKVDNATTAALIETIDKCPSGALSYYKNNESNAMENKDTSDFTQVEVLNNGPLLVKGTIEVTHADGSTEIKERRTSFCRCGKTGNVPFCDGSHKA